MTILTTRFGRIEGVTLENGIRRFFNVPFAEAPVGALRFEAAQSRTPWRGTWDGTRPGPTSPQIEVSNPLHRRLASPGWIKGDDTLNLNVWTPDPAASLPVAVWIYGGAFKEGGGSIPLYDGASFARDGIVAVSINYRIGAEGFLQLDGSQANRGLRDQVFALEWIRDNIADFGGDPSRVTIFGQSAGGASVASMVATPAATGLFRAAINHSGPTIRGMDLDDAARTTTALARRLGVPATSAGLGSAEPEELLAAVIELTGSPGNAVAPAEYRLGPVHDPEFLPWHESDDPAARFASRVPVIAGFTSEEFLMFAFPDDPETTREQAVEAVVPAMHRADEAVEAAHAEHPDLGWSTIARKYREQGLFADGILGWLSDARATGLDAWGYEFGYRSTSQNGWAGAYHDIDIPFVFDILDRTYAADMTGESAPQALADRVHGDWVRFFREPTLERPQFDGTVGSLEFYDVAPRPSDNTTASFVELFRRFRA